MEIAEREEKMFYKSLLIFRMLNIKQKNIRRTSQKKLVGIFRISMMFEICVLYTTLRVSNFIKLLNFNTILELSKLNKQTRDFFVVAFVRLYPNVENVHFSNFFFFIYHKSFDVAHTFLE